MRETAPMGTRGIGGVDRRLGDAIEALTAGHHRRRLRRLGHGGSVRPPEDGRLWAAGDPPPRAGNALEVLVDGAPAMAAVAEAVRGARRHVHLAGWCVTPELALDRGEPPLLLRELLAEAAERVDVRVLLWAGAPVPLFKPTRAAVRDMRERLVAGTRIRAELDARERPAHCHHEKLVVVDDEVAFVGGIDLTSFGGDRWDTPEHPPRGRLGWHDAATRLRGPAVADVAAHFALRWREVAGEPLAAPAIPPPAGDVEVQVVRTVPERVYDALPRGDFRIVEAYLRALRSARELVYLESQFLWSPEVTAILEDKLRRPPSDGFRIVVLLPVKANNGQDDTAGQLARLEEADGGRGRFLATTISAVGRHATDRIYVHAKVGIVDDRWLTLGSANLNAHSFFNDTEVNLVACDPGLARDTRLRLWAEHLDVDRAAVDRPAAAVVDELWRPIAREQLERVRRGEHRTHRLLELPGGSRRYERLLGPLDSILVDG
jgi:phosphatidylserine/phosphatidylglycerophosphate/cardiolipin synthase-like enzyme